MTPDIKQRKKNSKQKASSPEPQATETQGLENAKDSESKQNNVGKENVSIPKPSIVENDEPKVLKKKTDYLYNFVYYLLTIFAVITRSYLLHHPGEVVFDEVHFGKFASYYLRREYYFDVHPPLGKMLLAGVGYIVGYDGHFLFDSIGLNYADHNVPYVAFRLFTALCGAAVVPFAIMIMREIGISIPGIIFGATLLIFDTGLITQSRLILLDSMLMLFCVISVYFWIRFHKERHNAFSFNWWFWLAMTGTGLAMVLGVKLVGLFTVATVGIATLFDLWEILDIKRNNSIGLFGKHFAARALCLIVLPIVLYLVPFYIHFAILTNSGPGDAFMSLEFQETLHGNTKTAGSTEVPFFANVTIAHSITNHYMHSHVHKYPLRYTDGRVSSQGQQVNAYAHFDNNSYWQIQPVDRELFDDGFKFTGDVKTDEDRYIAHETYVRLYHITTDSYLTTHDVASPLTQTNMEITAIKHEDSLKRYNDTVWQIIRVDGGSKKNIKSKKDSIFIQSVKHKVSLKTYKSKLPEWGYKMQEMNGNKKMTERDNHWIIRDVIHEKIDENSINESESKQVKTMPFLKKFFELQGKMIHHNNALTSSHPYSSTPITWPFVLRGISFWEKAEGLKQIYLIGNPIAWYFSIFGPLFYIAMWTVDRIILHRGIDDFGPAVRQWWDKSIGFLLVAWILHWFPFFLMGRQLFLHHYMPSFIFSTIVTASLFDFIGRSFTQPLNHIHKKTRFMEWRKGNGGYVFMFVTIILIGLVLASFYYFMPFCYGLGFPTKEILQSRKLIPTWDFQYA